MPSQMSAAPTTPLAQVPHAQIVAYDLFRRTVAAGGWGTPDFVAGAGPPPNPWNIPIGTPSFWSVNGTNGLVALDASGAVQGADLLQAVAATVTVRFDVSFSALPSPGNFVFALAWMRVSGDSTSAFYRVGIFVDNLGTICLRGEGVPAVTLWPDATPVGTPIAAPGMWLTVAAQLTTVSTTNALAKVWQVGSPEPTWGVSGTDPSSIGPQVAGPVGIRAMSTADAITVSFDNFAAALA